MNENEITIGEHLYRIFRPDQENLTIQQMNAAGTQWETISSHGNSVPSLANGLTELIGSQHIPDSDDTLGEQISWLKDAIEFYGDRILTALEVAGQG